MAAGTRLYRARTIDRQKEEEFTRPFEEALLRALGQYLSDDTLGLLSGFVSINPRWAGFKVSDYYEACHSADYENDSLEISINRTSAKVIGRSRVTAAVFGGGRHTWHLRLTFDLKKTDDGWKFMKAQASTY